MPRIRAAAPPAGSGAGGWGAARSSVAREDGKRSVSCAWLRSAESSGVPAGVAPLAGASGGVQESYQDSRGFDVEWRVGLLLRSFIGSGWQTCEKSCPE